MDGAVCQRKVVHHMKWVFLVTGLLAGATIVLLLFRLGAVDFADGLEGIESEPAFTLPTYLTFVGVMLTVVTVVLAAVAIGIGVVAAYTVQELRERAEESVAEARTIADEARREAEAGRKEAIEKVEGMLSTDALDKRIRAFVVERHRSTVAELEEDFDPEDTGNR